VEKLGLVVNTKKLMRIFIMLVVGLSMIFYGVISFYFNYLETHESLTDQEIIERAKDLGLIDPKETVLKNEE